MSRATWVLLAQLAAVLMVLVTVWGFFIGPALDSFGSTLDIHSHRADTVTTN